MPKLQIMYITGLGDKKPVGQMAAVALWRMYGVWPHFMRMKWGDGEPFAPKFERLLKLVDELYEKSGQPIGIVGVSAGATAALNAYALKKDKILGVVTICGKILYPEKVGAKLREHNPAFSESMNLVAGSLQKLDANDRAKILSVYSDGDTVVPMQSSLLEGANTKLVGHANHPQTITKQITLGARKNLQFLKQL